MTPQPRGYLMLLTIVFGAIFLGVLGSLSGYVLSQNEAQVRATGDAKAFSMAEAGLEYYHWYLAHNPGDITHGTGQPGPYVIPYNDPEGGEAGEIALEVTGNLSCGQTTSIDIRSTGIPSDGSGAEKTVVGRYAQPTVAQFSYVLNDSVWAGEDRVINGPYHSNGGIRMDGTANAPVTSSLSTWLCTSSFGCSPNQTKNGVWGNGSNQELWSYPVPQVDFSGIAADFSTLKTYAQADGIYLPRYSSGNSNGAAYWRGYHLIFNANNTVTVRRVSSTVSMDVVPVNSADPDWDRARIQNETNYATYSIPEDCGLIYVEDNVWVEGTISDKVTVVAANVINTGVEPSAYLKGNITYSTTNGTAGLALIAEKNVLIVPDSPHNMTLNGIFIAQGGAFGRNLYGCPSSYEPRGTLTILGTTVSNKRTGTKWENGCGWRGDAGYQTRVDAYDRKLATDPPPFTPTVSSDYTFVDWREE
ncbi:MAG TPA: hypothetical protein VEA92_00730 [Candidatus Paceibacterota bacterium]|nr:hypothetical protein [Candidatus Paceibacterota bacterium]